MLHNMRTLSPCVFYCISFHFAFTGRFVTPWDHVLPQVWTDKSNSAATQGEGEDEANVCVLCHQKCSIITACGER